MSCYIYIKRQTSTETQPGEYLGNGCRGDQLPMTPTLDTVAVTVKTQSGVAKVRCHEWPRSATMGHRAQVMRTILNVCRDSRGHLFV